MALPATQSKNVHSCLERMTWTSGTAAVEGLLRRQMLLRGLLAKRIPDCSRHQAQAPQTAGIWNRQIQKKKVHLQSVSKRRDNMQHTVNNCGDSNANGNANADANDKAQHQIPHLVVVTSHTANDKIQNAECQMLNTKRVLLLLLLAHRSTVFLSFGTGRWGREPW